MLNEPDIHIHTVHACFHTRVSLIARHDSCRQCANTYHLRWYDPYMGRNEVGLLRWFCLLISSYQINNTLLYETH